MSVMINPTMITSSDHQCDETLFNSVETELIRQLTVHNVPPVFTNRPPEHLRTIVKSWWQIYHESTCARNQKNRAVWERKANCPAVELNAPELVASLQEIQKLIDLDALQSFRPLSRAEEASLCLLLLMTMYYANHDNCGKWMQIL